MSERALKTNAHLHKSAPRTARLCRATAETSALKGERNLVDQRKRCRRRRTIGALVKLNFAHWVRKSVIGIVAACKLPKALLLFSAHVARTNFRRARAHTHAQVDKRHKFCEQ